MDAAQPIRTVSAADVFFAFLRQGLTAFGGPVAHLAYFRKDFVERRGWLSEAAYADLVALCHFLPGPASSQVGMAIGLRQAGLAGALAAFAGFTLPAAALMIAFATFAPDLILMWGDGWIHGLKIAGKCPTRISFAESLRKVTKYNAAGMMPQSVSFQPGVTPMGDPAKCSWCVVIKTGVPVPDAKSTCGKLVDTTTGKVIG